MALPHSSVCFPATGRHGLFGLVLACALSACSSGDESVGVWPVTVRFATFNVAIGMAEHGELAEALKQGHDPRLRRIAEILQRTRPDVVLLNEFDYDPSVDAATLFNENYASVAENDQDPLTYPFSWSAPVNTGVDSGLDLDLDGKTGSPNDAWGFGKFAGQYGMLILSKYPINAGAVRTFQKFRWRQLANPARPVGEDGSDWYPEATWNNLRLSSKSHWDVPIEVAGETVHLLAFHPTPPVFDGVEDRNGHRNFDEIGFWKQYLSHPDSGHLVDDAGRRGGLEPGAAFVIAGDFNADPQDGDSLPGAVAQLIELPAIDSSCVPASRGAAAAARTQGGVNSQQSGDPAFDTADFNDETAGNLRLDYLLPAKTLTVLECGVFWPAEDEPGHSLVDVSDHRLVWIDVETGGAK